jgi:hypothetical protein
MKLATQTPAYHDAQPFEPPPGVVAVPVQVASTLPSGNEGVVVQNEYFIEGTEPVGQLPPQPGGGVLSRLFHSGNTTPVLAPGTAVPPGDETTAAANPDGTQPPAEKKGGVLKRFLSIFKSKNSKPADPPDATKKAPPEG